jgi:hypothetical protein
VFGWLWPDSSRRTRFLRMRRNRGGVPLETRDLLTKKPRASNWQASDADIGQGLQPRARAPSLLVASPNHGFAFSQNDTASTAIAAIVTLNSPRRQSATSYLETSTVAVRAAVPSRQHTAEDEQRIAKMA